MVRIGRMRHRVEVQQVTETRDSYGGVVETWSTFAKVWAGIEPLSGREYIAAAQTDADISHRITMRYLDGITPKMQIVFRDRTFNILSILNRDERNAEMQIMASEDV